MPRGARAATGIRGHMAAFALLLSASAQPAHTPSPAPVLVHTFQANGVPTAHLYGYREGSYAEVYSGFELRSSTTASFSILYRIDRNGLYLGDGTLDAPIHDDRSRGFTLHAKAPGSVTIDCCWIRGPLNGRMDPIVVQWNKESRRFELQKTP